MTVITRCDRKRIQSVTGIAEWDRKILQNVTEKHCKVWQVSQSETQKILKSVKSIAKCNE